MEYNDKSLRKAERRDKLYHKRKNGMKVSNRSIFILEEQKVRKAKKVIKAQKARKAQKVKKAQKAKRKK